MTDPDHIMPPIRPEECASLRDRATRPAAQARSGLGDTASIPSARPLGPIKNDSCHPDDPGQDYIDCPNCAAGRIYSLECDCCGWEEGKPLRDWSHRRLAQGVGEMVPNQPYRQWFDGDRLRTEPIPLDEFYTPVAQAIEARSDETRSGSAVGESAVTEGHAPDHIMPPIPNPGPLEAEEGE